MSRCFHGVAGGITSEASCIDGCIMMKSCPLCKVSTSTAALAEVGWLDPELLHDFEETHPHWRLEQGACPNCVLQFLQQALSSLSELEAREGLNDAWPRSAQTAMKALPTPLHLHADPRYTGRGVTIAIIDAGFYPHPDLVQPDNRIRAWVNAGVEPAQDFYFPRHHAVSPQINWDDGAPSRWHGLMTSTTAAGNGTLSHGLYRGLASEAELVLIRARDPQNHITNATIARALRWLLVHGKELGVRVVSISLAGDPMKKLAGNVIDTAIAELFQQGILVVAAAGNDGVRSLVPPATAPQAVTVGGLDDQNSYDVDDWQLWHSNYGVSSDSRHCKPELVAPSLWVVAPILPNTDVAREALELFQQRALGNSEVEARIEELNLVTPYYQHVEGTSFSAPLVASVAACMLQANPKLTPGRLRELLVEAAQPIPGVSRDRQGAGAIQAGWALELALADLDVTAGTGIRSPEAVGNSIYFRLLDPVANEVTVLGSWNHWAKPGLPCSKDATGIWTAVLARPRHGCYAYKYLLDGEHWRVDPRNVRRIADGEGGWNSVLAVAAT